MAWQDMTIDQVLGELGTDLTIGLSPREAEKRTETYGKNLTAMEKERQAPSGGLGGVLLSAVILVAAALLCLMEKAYIPAAVLGGAALLTTALRLWSFARVRRVLNSIAVVTAPMTTVVRAKRPGRSSWSGLGSSARRVMVLVLALTSTPVKFRWPGAG